jgi:TetR/AcrR family transcriptional regulator
MASRRFGNEGAETRAALLDLAEQMMSESGYAAVTSRQLGKAAGLSPQIVYYYFKTMDDLFVAVASRSAEYYLQAIERAKDSEEPLVFLWELSCDRSRAIVVQELMALANHRKILMGLLSDFGREYHLRQTKVIEQEIAAKRLDPLGVPAEIIAATLEVTARGFASGVGYDIPAHAKAQAYITDRLREMARKAAREAPAAKKTRSL